MSAAGLQWWCSAGGGSWTWQWRPYPGVWLFIGAVSAAYVMRWRAVREAARRRALAATAGLLLLWLALDWPIGPLGAGYLETAHMVQFILIVMLAPPLLLAGLPRPARTERRTADSGRVRRPLLALALSATLIVIGHTPTAVDALMPTQLGSMALDVAWLGAGIVLWWPLFSPRPEDRLPVGPHALVYLFLALLADKAIGIWLLLSPWPVYRTYELAPPIGGVDAATDQGIAAGVMLVTGMLILFVAVAVLAQQWSVLDRAAESDLSACAAPRRSRGPSPPSPASCRRPPAAAGSGSS